MSFILQTDFEFTVDCKIIMPGDDTPPQTLRCTYRYIDEQTTMDRSDGESVKAVLRQMIVSLDDIVADDNTPRPYSAELLEELLCFPFVRTGLLAGYASAVHGAKSGN